MKEGESETLRARDSFGVSCEKLFHVSRAGERLRNRQVGSVEGGSRIFRAKRDRTRVTLPK